MRNMKNLVAVMVLSLFSIFAIAADKININTAGVETLDTQLIGVGATKAQAIIKYREEHGPFKSIDDLALVKGIGEKTVGKNRENITVDELSE